MSAPVTLVWLRRDLRIDDNPALHAAAQRGGAVIPVYLWTPDEEKPWSAGAATRWWLHHSLESLEKSFRGLDSRLIIRTEDTQSSLEKLIQETGADAVYWNRLYEPATIARDTKVKSWLRSCGIEAESFNSHLLFEPWQIKTREGKPYQVFTAYWKACLAGDEPASPEESLENLAAPSKWPKSVPLNDLELLPKIAWDEGFKKAWKPGEAEAQRLWARFLKGSVNEYNTQRDFPGKEGTSRLSPYLHFGEISVRMMWHTGRHQSKSRSETNSEGAETYLKELVWREFAHHLLFHFPKTTNEPLRPEFSKFPWEKNKKGLQAWRKGMTGFPIVDAGMRELWTTGWMHNRVRMIVASFLVKDLRLNWLEGAEWFWDTLVDADLANNTLGWQWSAGCGADAAPYFRVFNPTLQSEKFDAQGTYIRHWVPELKRLPDKWLHQPWEAPETVLEKAGVTLGKTYPQAMVDHSEEREKALQAFASLKK